MMTMLAEVDRAELEMKVKAMYRQVALDPRGEFHLGARKQNDCGRQPAFVT
jgi:hypothetical protein